MRPLTDEQISRILSEAEAGGIVYGHCESCHAHAAFNEIGDTLPMSHRWWEVSDVIGEAINTIASRAHVSYVEAYRRLELVSSAEVALKTLRVARLVKGVTK